ncbi:hypothetical protein FB446DRAFT_812359 [Lentinula raphanica]|nr:hypothetical protein FB446DRAFT_812359 [Lentinula raphanica]
MSYSNRYTKSNNILQNAKNISISGGSFNVAGRDIIYKLSNNEERKFIKWLDAAPDSSINFSTAFDKIAPGTSQWILENSSYLDWKEEQQKKILWIQGKAGSGKTLLIYGNDLCLAL